MKTRVLRGWVTETLFPKQMATSLTTNTNALLKRDCCWSGWWWWRRRRRPSSRYHKLQWDIICFRDTAPSNSEAITLRAQRSENMGGRSQERACRISLSAGQKPWNSWGNEWHFSQKSREFGWREGDQRSGIWVLFHRSLYQGSFEFFRGVRRVWADSNNEERDALWDCATPPAQTDTFCNMYVWEDSLIDNLALETRQRIFDGIPLPLKCG